jgi:CHAT domain
MTRTIIRLEKSGKSVSVTLDRAPELFDPNSWKINLQNIIGLTLVERGQELLGLLVKRDPVKTVLGAAFKRPVNSPPSPLYFHIRALAADPIPWEQLHVKDIGFCALDTRWPIGRIAGREDAVRGRPFKSPLRIVAVLSAAGRDGSEQLEALRAAIDNAGMPVQLHVISGDESVLTAATGANITSAPIAGNVADFCAQIVEAKPHVLHLLCHGGAEAGVSLLSFGRIDDFDAGRTDGRLRLPVSDLVAALQACDPWLVVLAACESAGAADDVANGRALAHEMVEKGITAVIGMRRLVDLADTNRFCEHLYPGVLAEIREAVRPLADGEFGERTIDWAVTLTTPRKVMSDGDPAGADSWLDPVLYAQREDLRIFPPQRLSPEEIAEMEGQLDKFRQFLATQDTETLDHVVETEVRARIADVEARLRSSGN